MEKEPSLIDTKHVNGALLFVCANVINAKFYIYFFTLLKAGLFRFEKKNNVAMRLNNLDVICKLNISSVPTYNLIFLSSENLLTAKIDYQEIVIRIWMKVINESHSYTS